MEIKELNQEEWQNRMIKNHRRGKIMGGLLIVTIGSLFLARELGMELPSWLLSWKTLLIGLGIVSAVKHKFRSVAWIVLIGVGSIFLMNDFYPDLHIKPIVWPIFIIFVGLVIMFKPRRRHPFSHHRFNRGWKHKHGQWRQAHWDDNDKDSCNTYAEESNEDVINSTSIFGGVKKNIYSKKFKGGSLEVIFGGAELNLLQADIENKAKLEITQIFGGTKLIVPANWKIQSELVAVLGGIEDKRSIQTEIGNERNKILVLTGTVVFGGIEITSI